jgi:hypothetical protein
MPQCGSDTDAAKDVQFLIVVGYLEAVARG